MCTYGTVANSTSADWFQRTLVILVTSRPRVRLNSAGGGNYPRVGWAAGGGSGSGSRSGGCCFFATARWGTGWQRLSRLRPTVGIIFAGSLLCCLQKQLHCTYSLPTYLPTYVDFGKITNEWDKNKEANSSRKITLPTSYWHLFKARHRDHCLRTKRKRETQKLPHKCCSAKGGTSYVLVCLFASLMTVGLGNLMNVAITTDLSKRFGIWLEIP